jgi:prepilin-type N-terminal cleavage/methylation domain-containing protein/prepilin-type processing-associated H-X9-DG protein
MDKHRLQKVLMKSSAFRNVPEEAGNGHRAFTLIELVVVVAVVALLAVMCISALAKTRPNTQAFQCMNNLKQLTRAWRMYADDNSDILVSANSGTAGRTNWMTGNIDFNPANLSNWYTNQDLAKSPLWSYVGQQATLFHCPADPVLMNVTAPPPSTGIPKGQYPRVRSISMSQVFGNGYWQPASLYRLYSTVASIVIPAKTFLLLDEHPDSINDGSFGWSDNPPAIVDNPASYHNDRAAGFSFADGHSEIHRWQGTLISPPFGGGMPPGGRTPQPADVADIAWMCDNNTVLK